MVSPLAEYFRTVTYYDIAPAIGFPQGDFLSESRKFDVVITNPPYGRMTDQFVQKAKEITKLKFAFLLRTNYLSGQTRFNQGIYGGLRSVYIFTRMPDLRSKVRDDGKYTTAGIVYAWMIWEIGYTGSPQFDWIDNQQYVLKKREAEC